ncbi:hypothetical protein XNA1_550035 [Xenorhabdus nematophila str. Anatoliense]|nr:hypothetical protein XNA1_2330035 [Xenorhabdus nematophila str. Anatoliense]CEE95572.1 hypothetical protein XNA1_550035 [Xenorhabdus nematophila str. Anatoliense]
MTFFLLSYCHQILKIKQHFSMQTSIINEFILSDRESSSLWDVIQKIPESYDQEKNPIELEFLASDAIKNTLDSKTLSKIKAFKENKAESFLLLRNFIAIKNLLPTPTNDVSPDNKGWRTPAAALLGVLRLTGHSARSFSDEMNGRLCHMVMPAKNDEKSYLRSTKKLGFHTEVVNGYFIEEDPYYGQPVSPEIFGLIGLRNPDRVATTLLRLEYILEELDQDTIEELMKPNFFAQSQSSFDREISIENVPALKINKDGIIYIRYSHSKLIAKEEKSRLALLALSNAINNSSKVEFISLNPGDILIINNRICLHGRSSLTDTAQFNGFDRWLLRLYGYAITTIPILKTQSECKHIMMVEQQ